MRLPTLTKTQIDTENSRQLHEAIYAAHINGEPYVILTDDAKRLQYILSGTKKRFWSARGFIFHTQTLHNGLRVWLAPVKANTGAAA